MTDIKAWIEERQACLTHVQKHPHPDPAATWAQQALSMIEAVLAVHQPHPSNPLRCAAEYELRPCPTEEATMDALEGVIDGE